MKSAPARPSLGRSRRGDTSGSACDALQPKAGEKVGLGRLVVLLLALGLTGCFAETLVPYRPGAVPRVGRPAAAIDSPPREHPAPSARVAGRINGHELVELWRPRPCSGSPLPRLGATAYVSRAPGAKRWVVVLPIWGSSTYPPRKAVRWLLARPDAASLNVLRIHGHEDLFDWAAMRRAPDVEAFLAEVERGAACIDAATEDVRGFLDWVAARPDTDPARIGVVGFSIGAMVGALAMGRDPRFATGVFMMGGGHFEQVFAECYGETREVRDRAMARFGWSVEEFTRRVGGPLARVDPVAAVGGIDPARVLYFDAGHDHCIPRTARDDFWRALGEPERITIGYDHKSSFLAMTFLGADRTIRRLVDFLGGQLASPPRAAPAEAVPALAGRGRHRTSRSHEEPQ